jgi:hypothetical protein
MRGCKLFLLVLELAGFETRATFSLSDLTAGMVATEESWNEAIIHIELASQTVKQLRIRN